MSFASNTGPSAFFANSPSGPDGGSSCVKPANDSPDNTPATLLGSSLPTRDAADRRQSGASAMWDRRWSAASVSMLAFDGMPDSHQMQPTASADSPAFQGAPGGSASTVQDTQPLALPPRQQQQQQSLQPSPQQQQPSLQPSPQQQQQPSLQPSLQQQQPQTQTQTHSPQQFASPLMQQGLPTGQGPSGTSMTTPSMPSFGNGCVLVPMMMQGPDGPVQVLVMQQPGQQHLAPPSPPPPPQQQQQQPQQQQPQQQQPQQQHFSQPQFVIPHNASMIQQQQVFQPQQHVQHYPQSFGAINAQHQLLPHTQQHHQQQPTASDAGPKQLIVNFLEPDVTNADLLQLFTPVGRIEVARIVYDKSTNVSKGFGFVYFVSSADAALAIRTLSGHVLRGRRIKVSFANPQRPAPTATSMATTNTMFLPPYGVNSVSHQHVTCAAAAAFGGPHHCTAPNPPLSATQHATPSLQLPAALPVVTGDSTTDPHQGSA